MTQLSKNYLLLSFSILCLFIADVSAQSISQYIEYCNETFDAEKAYETTDYVSEFWRLAGNPGFDSSIYRVERILKAAGYVLEQDNPKARLTYRIEKYPLKGPSWEPLDAQLFIEGQSTPILDFKTNRNMLAINSFSTPGEGIVGELVYLENCSEEEVAKHELRGKIVMADCGAGRIFNSVVKKQGALGILTYGIPFYNRPEDYPNSISFGGMGYDEELKSWVIKLSLAAKRKLKKALEKGSVKLRVKIKTHFVESEELTILAEVKGSKKADERFVFSAHVQEPGANDNASGVGAQAEMARTAAKLLKAGKIDPARTITFLWGDEIRSTNRYIRQDKDRAAKIKWGISLDMVGEDTDKTGGTFLIEKMPDPSAIWTRGDEKHSEWGASEVFESQFNPHYFNDLIEYVCRQQAKRSNWVVKTNPFEGGSDHQPFLDADIPGLLLWHFTDVFYHTDGDRIDKVSAKTLKNVGVSALSSALFLCQGTEEVADEVLSITETAAMKRLTIEGKLSAKALKEGSSIYAERDILWTWAYWYGRALPKVKDVLVTDPSQSINEKISLSLKRIGDKAMKEMGRLD